MRNYIIYKGLSSERFKNLIVSELPPIIKPMMRTEYVYTEGVDGVSVINHGYDVVQKPVTIGLKNAEHLDEIIEWLTGVGDVTFSNEPDKYYRAFIAEPINYERLARFKTASVVFTCQPYKYLLNDNVYEFTTAGEHTVYNNGTVDSLPLIEIEVALAAGVIIKCFVNNSELFTLTFLSVPQSTYIIDSEAKNVYRVYPGTEVLQLKNSIYTRVSSTMPYPIFKPGANTIEFVKGVTPIALNLKIYPRSRFI